MYQSIERACFVPIADIKTSTSFHRPLPGASCQLRTCARASDFTWAYCAARNDLSLEMSSARSRTFLP